MAELSYPQTETAQTVFRTDSSTHILVFSKRGDQVGAIQEIKSSIIHGAVVLLSVFRFVLDCKKDSDIFDMMKNQCMPFDIEVRRAEDGFVLKAFKRCWLTNEEDVFHADDYIIYNSAKILAEKEGA